MTGAELKQRRENLNLSQNKLAEVLGTTGQTIYRWEAGTREIGNSQMLGLALKTLEREMKKEKPHGRRRNKEAI